MRSDPATETAGGSAQPSHAGHRVALPPLRGLLWSAAGQLAETTFAPTGLFWLLLHTCGLRPALIGGLALNYTLVLRRLVLRQPVPSLLLLGSVLLTGRTAAAVATGSTFVYFLQSPVNAFLLAAMFGGSVARGRPLVHRLAGDFVELPARLAGSRALHTFFRQVTLLWALVNVVNGAVTLHVLLAHNVDTVLLVRSTLSPALTATAVAVSIWWGRCALRSEGITLQLTWRGPAEPAAA